MYLSRIELDTQRRTTLKLLSSPNNIHGMVECAFEGERKRHLWRIDYLQGKTYLLLLSEDKPDFTFAAKEYAPKQDELCQTKDYTPLLNRIDEGSQWHFRLTANPTKSVCKKGARGQVRACGNVSEQEEWLRRQGERHGFLLSDGAFRVIQSKWMLFTKGKENKYRVSLRYITYEGILKITDPVLFREVLISGLGRGKAYGAGLLTIARQMVGNDVRS